MYEDKERMIEAYSLLYDIETSLVHIIVKSFEEHFGINYMIYLNRNIKFDTATYDRLVSFFGKYPRIFPQVTDLQRMRLYKLTPIRHKICHMKHLTDQELQHLVECHELVLDFCKEKVQ